MSESLGLLVIYLAAVVLIAVIGLTLWVVSTPPKVHGEDEGM